MTFHDNMLVYTVFCACAILKSRTQKGHIEGKGAGVSLEVGHITIPSQQCWTGAANVSRRCTKVIRMFSKRGRFLNEWWWMNLKSYQSECLRLPLHVKVVRTRFRINLECETLLFKLVRIWADQSVPFEEKEAVARGGISWWKGQASLQALHC